LGAASAVGGIVPVGVWVLSKIAGQLVRGYMAEDGRRGRRGRRVPAGPVALAVLGRHCLAHRRGLALGYPARRGDRLRLSSVRASGRPSRGGSVGDQEQPNGGNRRGCVEGLTSWDRNGGNRPVPWHQRRSMPCPLSALHVRASSPRAASSGCAGRRRIAPPAPCTPRSPGQPPPPSWGRSPPTPARDSTATGSRNLLPTGRPWKVPTTSCSTCARAAIPVSAKAIFATAIANTSRACWLSCGAN